MATEEQGWFQKDQGPKRFWRYMVPAAVQHVCACVSTHVANDKSEEKLGQALGPSDAPTDRAPNFWELPASEGGDGQIRNRRFDS